MALLLSACATYRYLAVKRVYGAAGATRIVQTALVTVALIGVFFAYRFVLLPITLYTT